MLRWSAGILLILCGTALAVTQDEVIAGAEQMYRKRIAEIEQRGALDRDAAFMTRATGIAHKLIRQANRDYPETAAWSWEIHTTIDADESASCMAGGKLLIGQAHVDELRLNDAELAMMLSHEIQHAIQRHNLLEYEEALRIDPALQNQPFAVLEDKVDNDADLMHRLAGFNFAQEIEADREGLLLASRAGWPAHALANYFKKLTRASARPNFDSESHPAPAHRWLAARELAERLDAAQTNLSPK